MEYIEQIKSWLGTALSKETGSITESFYYDTAGKMFFSIMAFDYMMFDELGNRNHGVSASYSNDEMNAIGAWIERIEIEAADIISIERIGLQERKDVMQQFVNDIARPALADALQQQVYNQDYNTRFEFYFGEEADPDTKQQWEDIRALFLQQRIEHFLALHNIDLVTTSLWLPGNHSTSITILVNDSITDGQAEEKSLPKKKWWNFWA
ncbi:MAG: hypothetical protein QM731_02360 [Chitinophagaceae bacterium]